MVKLQVAPNEAVMYIVHWPPIGVSLTSTLRLHVGMGRTVTAPRQCAGAKPDEPAGRHVRSTWATPRNVDGSEKYSTSTVLGMIWNSGWVKSVSVSELTVYEQ
jgi:hypothetical protein